MKKETLLDKARKIPIKKLTKLVNSATKEQIELAIAWAKDDITLGQFTKVIWNETTAKGIGGRALYTIASWLKAAIKRGILK